MPDNAIARACGKLPPAVPRALHTSHVWGGGGRLAKMLCCVGADGRASLSAGDAPAVPRSPPSSAPDRLRINPHPTSDPTATLDPRWMSTNVCSGSEIESISARAATSGPIDRRPDRRESRVGP